MMPIPFCTGAAAIKYDDPFKAAIEAGELARGSSTKGEPMRCPKCQTLAPTRVERGLSFVKSFIQPHIPDRYEIAVFTGPGAGIGFETMASADIPTTTTVRRYAACEMQPAELLAAVDRLYYDHPDDETFVAWRAAFVAEHGLDR